MIATAEPDIEVSDNTPDEQPTTTAVSVLQCPITLPVVTDLQKKYGALTIAGLNDKAGFAAVDEARRHCKRVKVDVEHWRKEQNEEALKHQRRVNAAAKLIREPLEALEEQLAGKQKAITDEVERLKREAEEKLKAERAAKLKSRMDSLAAVRAYLSPAEVDPMSDEDFSKLLDQKQQEEFDRIEAEKAEKQRQAEEAERLRLQREEIEAEQKKLADAKAELARQQREQAEREAANRHKIAVARLQTLATVNCHPAEFEIDGLSDERFAEYLTAATQRNQERIESERRTAEEKQQREEEEARQKVERERIEAEEKAKREEAARQRAEALKPDREKLLAFADAIEAMRAQVPELSSGQQFTRGLVLNVINDAVRQVRQIVEQKMK